MSNLPQLRSFIDGLLKDLEAEANDLKVENKTGDYVDMLQYCLYVYEVYIFRLGLNTAEDDMRFLVLKAKLPLAAVYMVRISTTESYFNLLQYYVSRR